MYPKNKWIQPTLERHQARIFAPWSERDVGYMIYFHLLTYGRLLQGWPEFPCLVAKPSYISPGRLDGPGKMEEGIATRDENDIYHLGKT